MIEHMLGETFYHIARNDEEIIFMSQKGVFLMYHEQDCCESVYIESVVGDLRDLLFHPILKAEEVITENDEYSNYTHTFYKFATKNGYVDIRWIGESNGYYSESVDISYFPFAERDKWNKFVE